MIYIRDGTHVYLLLMLLACVGEYPMQSVYLLGNNRVWKRRIKELQDIQDFCLPDGGKLVRFQMLTVSGKGKEKTMRLHKSALTGGSAISMTRSNSKPPEKRKRSKPEKLEFVQPFLAILFAHDIINI